MKNEFSFTFNGFSLIKSGFRKDRHHSTKGFTLVELSVVLVIFSFIVVTLFATRDSQIKARKNSYLTIEKIQLALEQYYAENDHYPCPADGSLAIDSDNFGKGAGSGTAACTAMNFSTVDSTPIRVGVVPIKDIGLNTEDMFDEWGNRITYAVSQAMTSSSASSNCGNIIVLKAYDDTKDPDAQSSADLFTRTASYVVMSHGKDGIGAYPFEGGSRIAATDLGGGDYVDSEEQQLNHHVYGDSFDRVFLKLGTPLQATP